MNPKLPLSFGIRLLLCCCLTSTSVFAADQLTRRSDGAIVRGKVETLSRTQIVIRRTNDEIVNVSPDDLRDLRFDREPPALQSVRSNERSGEFRAALKQLRQIQEDYDGGDERVVTETEFLAARCQARLALVDADEVETALEALQSFLRSHPTSYRALEAMLLQARLLATTDSAAAARLLKQLTDSGVDGFAVQAGVILGRTQLSEGNAAEALQTFDDLILRSQDKPDAATTLAESRIGRAACLQQLERPEEALQALDAVVAGLPENQHGTLARAWNRIGDCQRDLGSPQAALLAYLHVDLLYAEAAEAHAEALHRLSPLWEAAGHPDRAQDARTRLQERYPRSRWAEQSKNQR